MHDNKSVQAIHSFDISSSKKKAERLNKNQYFTACITSLDFQKITVHLNPILYKQPWNTDKNIYFPYFYIITPFLM